MRTTFNRSLEELTGYTLGALGDLSTSPPTKDKTRILPSFAADYMADPRTWIRLAGSKRVTDVTSSIFAPTETLLSTEPQVLPIGLPELTRVIELDIQRYYAPGETLKLFLFSSQCEALSYEFGDRSGLAGLALGDVSRSGMGMRYERPLGPFLYGQIGVVGSSTTSKAPGMAWDRTTAPYHPNLAASASANYIDRLGNKLGIDVFYNGRFFQDTMDTLPDNRPTITNVFNSRQIVYNDLPFDRRTWIIGWTHRL